MTTIAIAGVTGKMGQMVLEQAQAATYEVSCGLAAASPPAPVGCDVVTSAAELIAIGADVVVDFTVAEVARTLIPEVLAAGIHVVSGTTGLGDADFAAFDAATGAANLIHAPNFSIGAVLMMQCAALAAPHMPDADIVEAHGPHKLDAPSGTAIATANIIAKARSAGQAAVADTAHTESGVPVHSQRLDGVIARQEVTFGARGQTLRIAHDTTDRSAFWPGIALAIDAVASRPGVTYGIDALLRDGATTTG